jgi:hypothetical protein
MTRESDFTQRLLLAAPELQPLMDEHLADQEGELLPYLLMGDVAQWLHEHTVTEPHRVSQVLRWLEDEFVRGDFDVRNLIDVGIVEMLPAAPEGGQSWTSSVPSCAHGRRSPGSSPIRPSSVESVIRTSIMDPDSYDGRRQLKRSPPSWRGTR